MDNPLNKNEIKEENTERPLPVLNFEKNPNNNTKCDIKCLKCEQTNQFPDEKDDYLAHLFLQHRLVIADIEEIALLEEYLIFWHKEFKSHEFEEYCTTLLLDQLPDGTAAKNEKYFLLSDILPKDYELRTTLKKKRLENALAQHQFERTDRNFSKECLYCRDVITGLRSEYLEHLYNKHFLQLGKPENLIYIDDLITKVQYNLEQLICLFCEKVFKDRVTLKEHMRKKGHKRINPSNSIYDKYFLINYRNEQSKQVKNFNKIKPPPVKKPTKSNEKETALKDQQASQHCFDNSDDNDSDWSDWDGEQTLPLNCLYCTHQETEFGAFKRHLKDSHQVDFDAHMKEKNFYQKIKSVNYVRRQICLRRCVNCNERFENLELLLQHMSQEQHFGFGQQKQWDKPEYFFPTYEDDSLLCVLDDNFNDEFDETFVPIISEDAQVAEINKDAEKLSLENFKFL